MPDLQKFVRYVLGAAFCCYAYFALLYVSYWAHQSHLIIAVIAVGMVTAALLLPKWLQRFDFSVDVDARQSTQILWSIIAGGIAIRIL